MPPGESFPCYMVRKDESGNVTARIEQINSSDLPPGDVLIRVAYSSLNYKDALAAQGHPGVVRRFPHVPGIDCAGTVVESASPDYQVGDEVLVTGYELAPAIGAAIPNSCACRLSGSYHSPKDYRCATQ